MGGAGEKVGRIAVTINCQHPVQYIESIEKARKHYDSNHSG
jgi:hypothetical protein